METEYFLQGQANRYRITDPMKDAQKIDSGNAWIGVSAQRNGIEAMKNGTCSVAASNIDPTNGKEVDPANTLIMTVSCSMTVPVSCAPMWMQKRSLSVRKSLPR